MSPAAERDALPRRRLTAAARREVILEAALDAFADSGYHETSLEQVAGRAGVSKALIYEHFSSKRELYTALLETYVHEMLDTVSTAATAAEPGEARLLAGLNGFFDFVEERRDAWRLLIRHRASDDVADSFERLFDEVAEMIVSLMAGEMPASVLPEGAAFDAMVEATARQLLGAITSMANWWDEHREIPRDQVMAMVMEFAWVGLERASAGERWNPGPG
ncbi:MAG: TetR/AcrR family transcriptional regulator [Solirubrobacterales bacterium]|nr:TetR/AcrR family transcriptional regulator [Solirubrobacterales bacterium]